ncbi:hypothetical protein J2W49_001910 [Hydrogenophaga palleronii]|uniref:Type III effector protein n=1 Tax=Hydrogenophaga palleronii TaxID=65655 RepID=A0ABU1WKY0_9BURK|nr:hypothetical protein [Hydrogenophaga palleronii]MDR7149955.1 hypothetical protein [Hydrogenophaga palleronii]
MSIQGISSRTPAAQPQAPAGSTPGEQPGSSGQLPSSGTGLAPMASQAPDTAIRPRAALPSSPSPASPSGGDSPMLQRTYDHTPTYSPVNPSGQHVLQIDAPQQGQATQPAGRLSRLTGAIAQAGSTLRQRAGHAASLTRQGASAVYGQVSQGASAAYGQASQGAKLAGGLVKQGATGALTATGRGAALTGQDLLKALGPIPHAVGIAGAHLMQQAVTCGIPTFAREMAFIGLTMKLAENPGAAAGVQAAMTAINVAGHVIRHRRMDRNPEAAARGFHGMTKPQWDATPPDQQAAMMERQQRNSRWVTQMHAAAMVVNTGAMIGGLAQPGNENARLFMATQAASDVRNLIYAALRETGQASLSMVGLQAPNASGGVNDQRMSTSAFAYTVAQAAGSYGADAIVSHARPDIRASGGIIRTAAAELASGPALFKMAAVVASVRAVANTLGEVLDAGMAKHHEASQAGGRQVFSPGMPGANQYAQKKRELMAASEGNVSALQLAQLRVQTFRENVDISRLLDHSPARMAWNGTAATAADLASLMAPSNLRTALSSFGVAMMFGASYKPVNQTYQAHAAVRSQVRVDAQAQALADQGVPRTRLDRTWLSRLEVVPGSPPPSRESSLQDRPDRMPDREPDLAGGPSLRHLVAGKQPAIDSDRFKGSFSFAAESSSAAQARAQTLQEALDKNV